MKHCGRLGCPICHPLPPRPEESIWPTVIVAVGLIVFALAVVLGMLVQAGRIVW